MKILIVILWLLFFTKAFLFWLWLWQLKEYHFGRLRAHFETQKIKKIISSFWRIKCPKFTKKTIVILLSGLIIEILFVFCLFSLSDAAFYLLLLLLLILSPIISSLIVVLFQFPTFLLRKQIMEKARKKREQFKNLLVIGITGSYGKSSTKEFLAEILLKKYRVLKTAEHINAEIGIAQTILDKLTQDYEIFICEIGAYERGKIKEVCGMIKPKIGILTGINEQHLSTFGSQENIIKAKYELIESLPQDGLAVFNGSNKYCGELYQKTKIQKKLVHSGDWQFDLTEKTLFPWDRENICLAAAIAEYLGMSREEIASALAGLKSPVKIKKGIAGLTIIDSTYSANSKSVLSHLDYLREQLGKKVMVMPCLIELGKAGPEVHQRIGEEIGKICDLAIITTEDYFKELKKGAQRSGMPSERILLIEKPKEIFEKIKSFCQPNDTILLESRVPLQLVNLLTE